MPLSPGTRLGPYEITTQIGQGGMGEVYRATDTNLKRPVAIKVLPLSLAGDPDRLARFQREAEMLAALNHPNIAAIHGLERSDGQTALVMELVEGPTLADRIEQGAVPLDEAMAIAKQVADGLDSAHERGIIHRDLKPSNIKVRPDGTVKVLDFGLAKLARVSSTDSPDVSGASTAMATHAGLILGTMAYMSPEQARGQDLDKRTDVWAFGCVLYEMLSGRRPFEGDETSEILANVLKSDPDWRRLPSAVPEAVRLLLRRSLQKDSRRRLHDMADVRILIDEAVSAPGAQSVVEPRHTIGVPSWILAAVLALASGTAVWFVRAPSTPSQDLLDVATPPTSSPASFAIAPDDASIVFVATSGTQSGLWLRSSGAGDARPLLQTDGAEYPFWAPDSKAIAFFADRKLKILELASGDVRELIDAAPLGGSWSGNGTILFTRGFSNPLFRIAASGGEPVAVTSLDEHRHSSHRFPHFLPDGRRFLYTATGAAASYGVHVANLDAAGSRRVLTASAAVYEPRTGRLLFVQNGTLLTQRFDLDNAVPRGEASPLAENVELDYTLAAPLSASPSGRIAYRTSALRQLAWFSHSGTMLKRLGDAFTGGSIEISPDERRIVLRRTVKGSDGIWLMDTERGLFSPLAPDGVAGLGPVWAGNDRDVVFSRGGPTGVILPYRQQIGNTDDPQPMFTASQFIIAQDWPTDGKFVLYAEVDQANVDLWARPADGSPGRIPVANTKADERLGQFSPPDNKLVAYMSDESNGRFEIFVRRFPGNEQPRQVSLAGGGQPRWRRDGKALYYVALDGKLTEVSIQLAADGRITTGPAVPLFPTSIGGALQGQEKHQYVVTRDDRFLMNTVVDSALIRVLLNWNPKD